MEKCAKKAAFEKPHKELSEKLHEPVARTSSVKYGVARDAHYERPFIQANFFQVNGICFNTAAKEKHNSMIVIEQGSGVYLVLTGLFAPYLPHENRSSKSLLFSLCLVRNGLVAPTSSSITRSHLVHTHCALVY